MIGLYNRPTSNPGTRVPGFEGRQKTRKPGFEKYPPGFAFPIVGWFVGSLVLLLRAHCGEYGGLAEVGALRALSS